MRLVKRRTARFRYVPQAGNSDCGAACFAMVASHHGHDIPLHQLRAERPSSSRGMTLGAIMAMCHQFGFAARALRCELEDLGNVATPAILHWRFNHFVVLEKVGRRGLRIHDPASGSHWITPERASPAFTGVVLEIAQPANAQPNEPQPRRLLGTGWRIVGLPAMTAQILLLTAVIQLFVLASPYLFQIVIDRVIAGGNAQLLWPVSGLFLALAGLAAAAYFMRGSVIARAGSSFALQASVTVAQKLFRLPLSLFLQRDTGDLLSRLGSVTPLRDLLVGQAAQALLDGALALVVLAILFLYHPGLAAISLAALLLCASLTAASVPLLRRRQSEMIVEKAREQQIVIESIRGIATLRMFGKEAERLNLWQNHLTRSVNAELRHADAKVRIDAALMALPAVENIVLLAVAAQLVLAGSLSVGALVAYFAYKAYLFGKALEAMRFLSEYRMLKLHVERLRDITDQPGIGRVAPAPASARALDGRIELRDLSFRYSPDDPWVLHRLSAVIEPGTHVAIEGVSGSGKSTLMLLLLGLIEPSEGDILVDGVPLPTFGDAEYRRQTVGILQSDQLFSGSIRDNISFFDPDADFMRVQHCAAAAAIHHDIIAMPMRYETIVGEMGGTLSGGQKQRIVLARALYQQPRLLIVDEGTAHLDHENEGLVNDSIAALGITRIVFAHRRETLDRADVRYRLEGGRLVRLPGPQLA